MHPAINDNPIILAKYTLLPSPDKTSQKLDYLLIGGLMIPKNIIRRIKDMTS